MNNFGFTSIELLASATLSLLILSAVVAVINHETRIYLSVSKSTELVAAKSRLRSILQASERDLGHFRFVDYMRVHKKGVITYSGGEINPVSLRSDQLKPDPESDAFSAARINPLKYMEVFDRVFDGERYHFTACPRHGLAIDSQALRSYLAIGVDFYHEMTGTTAASGDCYKLSVRQELSMLESTAVFAPLLVTGLVPIEANYTYYLDLNRTLRYLGHRGALNVENQPVAMHFPPLDFRLLQLVNPKLNLLEARYFKSDDWHFVGSTFSNFQRKSLLNLVLNNP